MTYEGQDGTSAMVLVLPDDSNVVPREGRPWIQLTLNNGSGSTVTIGFDENHVDALILGLRSAVAEIQARAVSR